MSDQFLNEETIEFDLNDPFDFIDTFLKVEYEAVVACHSERDDTMFAWRKEALEQILAFDVRLDIERDAPGEAWFERGRREVASGNIAPRPFFAMRKYIHPTLGDLFRLYVGKLSGQKEGKPRYATNFFIARVDDAWKVIARYEIDGGRTTDAEKRFESGNLTWRWHSGREITELGPSKGAWKMRAPEDPVHLAEYNS